jgi:CheY-like chemotaxis protein
MVSHELRTPLHAIVGWVHVLQHANPAPEVATQALARIAASVGAQSRLIEDLLDVSRVVSGKLTLAREPVDPDPLVRTAVESMRAAAEQAGIDLHADVALDGAMVEGDAGRLQQVLANVLSNAVKFTPRGGRVRVDARRAAGAVEISVSDTGEGIGAAFLPHVFERFRQEDGGPGGRRGGLGLGLSIARHVCELHGGSIEASSAGKGQGATFRLRLPLMAGDAAVATPGTQTPLGGTPLTGLRVLLVEDDADARTALAHAMRAAGAEVLEAADGAAALAAARAQPEVLVSDLGLPDTDGHSLMRRLRESVPSLVHAIAVTAFRPPRTRDPDRFGFAAYIQKPIEPRTIIAALARWRDGRDGS